MQTDRDKHSTPRSDLLDVDFVRRQFPAFSEPALAGWAFFDNAGGSYPCSATVDRLIHFYRETKVQPYAPYPASQAAGVAMDHARQRWSEALGVLPEEVNFGPSTSQNTYVLAAAFASLLGSGDEIVVTNQDHEANTGVFRRMGEQVGASVREWRIDQASGLLDLSVLDALLSERTRLVCVPHCSNIVGQENNIAEIVRMSHEVGARVIIDAVSYAPHGIVDVGAVGADAYLFSLYKVYSVHQGLMVLQNGLAQELPNQGHFFNADQATKRLTPAGPDHAQVAAAAGVLDYMEALHRHHGGSGGLREAARHVTSLWQDHERSLVEPVLDHLAASDAVRLLGPAKAGEQLHRCPTVAFVPIGRDPGAIAAELSDHKVMAAAGHFYAHRVLRGLDVDPESGVVRVSWVHYTSAEEIDQLLTALDVVLTGSGP